ncbi:MAG TPA: molybdopterin synthase sulfur carrier subunit [Clostridiales bacterium UBA8153]|nr:molybdopterin synthase sulfur carrier subunit [Clostridiales bacterium UBA8153]
MRITVKLFALLREGRGKQVELELEAGASVGSALHRLGIQQSAASMLLVNGRTAGFDTALADGDVVAVFPPVGGG